VDGDVHVLSSSVVDVIPDGRHDDGPAAAAACTPAAALHRRAVGAEQEPLLRRRRRRRPVSTAPAAQPDQHAVVRGVDPGEASSGGRRQRAR